jgi:hypothetical protein
MGQVGDSRGDDVTTPAVFDGHGQIQCYAEIADLARLRQAANLRDLQIDDVHRTIVMSAHQCFDVRDVLVEDERQGRIPPDGQAMLVRAARLLDVDVPVADRVDHAERIVDPPARVRVGHEDFAVRKYIGGGVYAFDVVRGRAADF